MLLLKFDKPHPDAVVRHTPSKPAGSGLSHAGGSGSEALHAWLRDGMPR
ncbi:MAG: hypothetical protein HGB06_00690 [Chlorobaculum sp.]|nr:hypothetical protein [Chlorobaculum sp.]